MADAAPAGAILGAFALAGAASAIYNLWGGMSRDMPLMTEYTETQLTAEEASFLFPASEIEQ